MATLKEHQAAMVDLLANGSGIPASASRLAHAMHDLINVLYVAFPNLPQTRDEDWINGRETRLTITPDVTLDIKDIIRAVEANSPGLNDKALSKREKALKTDSPAKWPTPAEQRVKELENTIRQLKANNAKLKSQNEDLRDDIGAMASKLHMAEKQLGLVVPEQAGCRKEDMQNDVAGEALKVGADYAELGMKYAELVKILAFYGVDDPDKARAEYMKYNGSTEQSGCRMDDTRACEHEWVENAELGRPLWVMCEKCGAHK